jgi:tRNA dimethylallyltransferase
VVLLFGPTGVGKTELLRRLPEGEYEIISADSMQVYRGMDIGTAKPDTELLLRLPHHLIDILDPGEQFHLGEFLSRADKAAAEIRSRGRIPILSGGTAYYFKHFLFGLPLAPPSNPQVRQRLEAEAAKLGCSVMMERLKEADPLSAERIERNDRYRILRALEVLESCGAPLSSFKMPETVRAGLKPLIIGLNRPREELYRRIDHRVEEMFALGLPREVESLREAGYNASDPGMRAIGYREFFEAGGRSETDMKRIMATIQKNSRRYAKRQLTFFRAIDGARWFSPEEDRAVLEEIASFRSACYGSTS